MPPERVGPYLRDLRKLFQKYGYNCSLYGHFGQGCVHTRIDFELKTAEGVAHFRSFLNEAADLVVSHGGSISGEHGDGQSKAALLAQDVRARAGRGVPRVQGDLGPRQQDEPAQGGRPVPAGREPPAGAALPPAAGRDALQVPRRPWQLLVRDRALRRRRRVPQGGERHHVPELHGDQGGDALDAGPRPPAVRDVPAGPDEGALEGRAGSRGARPLPGVQGVPHRVPDERGHGHLQGRVPLALLRGSGPAEARLRDGPDLLVGPARLDRAGGGQPDHPRAGRRQALPVSGGHLDPADDAVVRPRDVQGVVAAAADRGTWASPG